MGSTSRDTQLQKIDEAIEAIEAEKVQIAKYAEVAKALATMQETDEYRLVFDQAFITDEVERITGYLAGDEHLSEGDEKFMNDALKVIRGFKTFLKDIKTLGETTQERLNMCDTRLTEEKQFRDEVFSKGEGELDG